MTNFNDLFYDMKQFKIYWLLTYISYLTIRLHKKDIGIIIWYYNNLCFKIIS